MPFKSILIYSPHNYQLTPFKLIVAVFRDVTWLNTEIKSEFHAMFFFSWLICPLMIILDRNSIICYNKQINLKIICLVRRHLQQSIKKNDKRHNYKCFKSL